MEKLPPPSVLGQKMPQVPRVNLERERPLLRTSYSGQAFKAAAMGVSSRSTVRCAPHIEKLEPRLPSLAFLFEQRLRLTNRREV
jgi:hypothetical protein